jgi:hypothetical protein
MELKRRTFVWDVLFDRILAASAIVISVIALVVAKAGRHLISIMPHCERARLRTL